MAVRRVHEIDWERWRPRDRATLVFLLRDESMLLIHKKRGLGAGKVNGPGGRCEPGETPEDCAVREVEEEVGLRLLSLERAGELSFQFVDGYAIHVTVFRSGAAQGSLVETDEAAPFWVPLDRIPYEAMWADDRLWLPLLLAGEPFQGRFVFEDDALLDHVLESGAGT